MKIAIASIAACAALFALDVTAPAFAQDQYDQQPYAVAVVPPREVMAIVRSQGFAPISRPTLRGIFYVVRAVEEDRIAVRVVVDGRTGRIVRVTETGEWHDSRFGAFTPPPGEVLGGASVVSPTSPVAGAERLPSVETTDRVPLPRPAPSPQKRVAVASPPETRPAAAPPVVLPPSMQAVIDGDKPQSKPADAPATTGSVKPPAPADAPATTGSVTPPAAAEPPRVSANTAPVSDAASQTAKPATRSTQGLELKPTEMVPVAPLE